MDHAIDLKRKPIDILIDEINYENKTHFTAAELEIGTPTVIKNGRTQVSAVTYGKDHYTITYWRMNLDKLFNFTDLKIKKNPDGTNPNNLLEIISKKYHIGTDDFTIKQFGAHTYLVANTDSVAYYGRKVVEYLELDVAGVVIPPTPETVITKEFTTGYSIATPRIVKRCMFNTKVVVKDPLVTYLYSVNQDVTIPTTNMRRKCTFNTKVVIKDPAVSLLSVVNSAETINTPNLRRRCTFNTVIVVTDPLVTRGFSIDSVATIKTITRRRKFSASIYTLVENKEK